MIRLNEKQISDKISFINNYINAENAATASTMDANANVDSKNTNQKFKSKKLERKMIKEISEMIKEIAERRCNNMEVQELEQFYIDAKIEQFKALDAVDIVDMYIEEVDEDYVHN